MKSIPAWLQSILEEHYEEFQMLWELRQQAILDPEYNRADLAELEERIAAHIDGLVLARASSIPMLIVGLAADEAPTVFAAAYVLLELGDVELAQQVLRALGDATAEQREGISQALCHGRIELIDNALVQLAKSGPAAVAAVCAQTLAFRGCLSALDRSDLFVDAQADVRRRAWQAVAWSAV